VVLTMECQHCIRIESVERSVLHCIYAPFRWKVRVGRVADFGINSTAVNLDCRSTKPNSQSEVLFAAITPGLGIAPLLRLYTHDFPLRPSHDFSHS
jgi:hypothetical protein